MSDQEKSDEKPVPAIPLYILGESTRPTERLERVLVYAEEEARSFNHNYIGTEHLLLGLLRETDGVGAKVLDNLLAEPDKARTAVEFMIGRGDRPFEGEIAYTPRCHVVFRLAVDEAKRLNHAYVGTEHLLLGLIGEGEGVGARILQGLGVNLEKARWQTILTLIQSHPLRRQTESAKPKDNVVTCRVDDRALAAIDALVEAGIRGTRSDAASWLIGAGIEVNRDLFEKVYATVAEIRRLRQTAQDAAEAVAKAREVVPSSAADESPAR